MAFLRHTGPGAVVRPVLPRGRNFAPLIQINTAPTPHYRRGCHVSAQPRMSQPKKYNNARLVPFILMSIVTLIFLFWAMRQCSGGGTEFAMQAEEAATRRSYLDTLRERDNQLLLQRKLDSIEQAAKASALLRGLTTPLPGDSIVRFGRADTVIERVTTLYSTIEGLNVRSGPSLREGKVGRLPLYGEMIFLNEVTDSLYEIDLGDITPSAPWVKVRLPNGKQGWVYGALVSYYKFRQGGVNTD